MKKRILLACMFALALTFSGLRAFAQSTADQAKDQASQAASQTGQAISDTDVRAKVEARLQKLATELNLTDDQKTQLKPVLQGEFKQLKAVHDDSSLSPDQKQSKMTEIHDGAKSQINSILTPEQQKKLAEIKENPDEQ